MASNSPGRHAAASPDATAVAPDVAASPGRDLPRRARVLLTGWRRAWWRSRWPWLWASLLLLWAVWDWRSGSPGPGAGAWTGGIHLAALLGFLAGYDGFTRFRAGGALGLLLLDPVRPTTVALAFFAAGTTASASAAVLYLAYPAAVAAPPPAVGVAGVIGLALLGTAGFAAFAQAASLALGRDAAAVLGFVVLLFGAGPPGRFVPADAPAWVGRLVEAAGWALPATHRLDGVAAGLDGGWGVSLLTAAHVAAALGACVLLLGRERGRPAGGAT